ncbi:hypothetical protein BOTBODRAFT_253822 [Botryobasidium botryosum FD-172 SS1]|uniref:Secreted protein n=1 Tax=Botryobasidium botryosum (strain FD-172 SS1) TaxID=930990 RepID=A0A067M4B8_BOTB1|nr:hypothetical protein BOTBODRAFT_253822 [Botryobasidium botryosum FD-172 SS1]
MVALIWSFHFMAIALTFSQPVHDVDLFNKYPHHLLHSRAKFRIKHPEIGAVSFRVFSKPVSSFEQALGPLRSSLRQFRWLTAPSALHYISIEGIRKTPIRSWVE